MLHLPRAWRGCLDTFHCSGDGPLPHQQREWEGIRAGAGAGSYVLWARSPGASDPGGSFVLPWCLVLAPPWWSGVQSSVPNTQPLGRTQPRTAFCWELSNPV